MVNNLAIVNNPQMAALGGISTHLSYSQKQIYCEGNEVQACLGPFQILYVTFIYIFLYL